jgi:hypothetical protein
MEVLKQLKEFIFNDIAQRVQAVHNKWKCSSNANSSISSTSSQEMKSLNKPISSHQMKVFNHFNQFKQFTSDELAH